MKTLFRWLKRLVALAVLAGIAYAGYAYFNSKKREAEVVRYRTAPVVRADVFRTVEATGTVQPIKEVEVGAQVNGRIVKLFVDYNSSVTNGQIVALIDPLVYEANYKSALGELHANQANVKKCEAQLVLAERRSCARRSSRSAKWRRWRTTTPRLRRVTWRLPPLRPRRPAWNGARRA